MPWLPPENLGCSAWQYTARLRAMPHSGHLAVMHQCVHCWKALRPHWAKGQFWLQLITWISKEGLCPRGLTAVFAFMSVLI